MLSGEVAATIALGVELAGALFPGIFDTWFFNDLIDDLSQIKNKQGEIHMLLEQSALKVTQNTTFPTMINQLTSFTNIWQIVNTDIDQSIAFINASISEDP